VFQDFPVVLSRLVIRLLGEDSNDVHNRKPPRFGLFVVEAADSVSLKNGQVFFQNYGVNSLNKDVGIVFQNVVWANTNGVQRLLMIRASAFSTSLRLRKVGGLCRPRYMI
jgi:hypothetical protein